MSLALRLFWTGLAVLIAAAALLIWVDAPLALYFHSFRDTAWFAFFAAITNLANGAIWYSLAVVAILICLARARFGTMPRERLMQCVRAWVFMVVAMATSGIAISVIKALVGRERPLFLFRDGTMSLHPLSFTSSDASFPSGHSQSIWSAMVALACIYPPARLPFLLVAVAVGASRVIIGAHYASDVIVGSYLGIAAALLWRAWFEKDGVPVTLTAPSVPSASPQSQAPSN